MRVVLINSPSLSARPISRSMAGGLGFDSSDQMLLPPLDLAIMAAMLRQHGDAVDLIDADPLRLDAAGVLARLEGRAYDAAIATVSLPTLEQDAAFLSELRRHHPRARIIGKTLIHEHTVLRAILELSGADLVIHGEADLLAADIVHGRAHAGTAWLEPAPDGGFPRFQFDAGEPVADLDRLPLPARDLLPNDRYCYPLLGAPVATLQTSRGCPYPCGYYCPYPLVEGVKWRAQTPERIAAELKQVTEDLGISNIYFRDATFTLNQDRIARLCDLICEAGWRISWVCETRVDCLSDGLLEKMRAAGCVGLLVGVETGNEQVMHHRDGKKGLTLPKLAQVRAKTSALGIRLHFLLIVGLPRETRESVVATYDLIRRYQPDTIGVTIITPYPGTPLHEEAVREGWLESARWQDYGGHQVPMHTPHLSREDLVTGKRFLEEGFALLQRRRSGEDRESTRALTRQHYQQLLRWAYRLDGVIAELRPLATSVDSHPAPRTAPVASEEDVGLTALGSLADRPEAARLGPPGPLGPLDLSIVIPTRDRRGILRKTLLAFASQTLAPDRFEVIVVDDGSSDDTIPMLERFTAPLALRVFSQRHQGPNAARNRGIGAARGSIVVLTGDDMIPEPGFLSAHLRFHQQHPAELDAMLGFIDWSPEITVTPFMRFLVSPEGGFQFAFHEVRDGMADFRLFYTSNVSLKARLLARQPVIFDSDFTYPAYDDVELGYRLARQGMRLHYCPIAVTCHHHEMTPESFAQRQRNAGRMAIVLARKHPELGQGTVEVEAILRSPDRPSPSLLPIMLQCLEEVAKVQLERLVDLRVQDGGFDQYYVKAILHPLYHALSTAAYRLGVHEGAGALQEEDGMEGPAPHQFEASIIIPVHNEADLTRQCLTSLAEVTAGVEFEVIVVDNGSTDETSAVLEQLSGDVQIIRNTENAGFAAACNQGAKAARGRHLVFLNNDTIPQREWLQALVQEVRAHPEVAVVGSKLLYPDGRIQHAGVVFSRSLFAPYHVYRQFPGDASAANYRREFQCVTAACMLIRRDVFEAVGGLDEGYRNGFEDVDLCLKVREQGWRVVYQPESVLYHLEGQSSGRMAHERENAERLFARWGDQWWLPDEDAVYFQDGYAMRSDDQTQPMRFWFEVLAEGIEKRGWEIVAEVQRQAQRRNVAAIRTLLARVEDWPDDRLVLRWGAGLCSSVGVPHLADRFLRRLLPGTDHLEAHDREAHPATTAPVADGA